MKKSFIAASIMATLGVTTTPITTAQQNEFPTELHPYYQTLQSDGEWGAVLNYNRLGLLALDKGHLSLAGHAFDASLQRIEAIYANTESAKKARSFWSAEGVKDFKGESYERAMAYYYRGLLFVAEGDYDNARAAFRSAEYQDTISNDEQYSGDFGLMSLLAGWSAQCNGDKASAQDLYKQAINQQNNLVAPDLKANTLILVESGTAPSKTTSGQYNEALQLIGGVDNAVGGTANGVPLALIGDISWQATTLGGRAVDQILDGKASFKAGADTTAAVAGSAAQVAMNLALSNPYGSNVNDMLGAGGAMAVIGIGAKLFGKATKPKADIRSWDNLPSNVFGGFLTNHNDTPIQVSLTDTSGNTTILEKPAINSHQGQCQLVVYRNTSGTLPAQAPSNLTERERKKVFKLNAARDAQFRAEAAQLISPETQATN